MGDYGYIGDALRFEGAAAAATAAAKKGEGADSSKGRDARELKKIKDWHWGYAVVQALSGVAILTTLLVLKFRDDQRGFQAYLFTDTFDLESKRPLTNIVGSFEAGWLIVPMAFLTSLSHVVQAVLIGQSMDPRNTLASRFVENLKKGINAIRWVEYSVTASLMTSVIFLLCGGTNVYLFFLLGIACNMALQWQGFQFELLMDRERWLERCSPMIAGFIIFTAQWAVLWTMFALTVHQNEGVPWFVWTSFIGLQTTFLVFPAIQIGRYYKWWVFKTWYGYEFSMNFASNLSKLLLDWTLAIAVITFLT